jgi:uncharacterized protein YmfQ (DUF2313 family)
MPCFAVDDPFRCPTQWDLWRQIIALTPTGRAWQTHQQVFETANVFDGLPAYELSGSSLGTEAVVGPDAGVGLTVQQQYWAALADVLAFVHRRACALLEEFFCATAREQIDEWRIDWGFPDDCLVYGALCNKVADGAGQTCADLVAFAAAAGWSVECGECVIDQNSANLALADVAVAACRCNALAIRVHLASSPAYVAPGSYPYGDLALADATTLCPPGLEGLQCLIEKLRPAHIPVTYEVI